MNSVFSLGSEWMYFKIYSGYKIADVILLEYLNKKIEWLLSENVIKKWFFIRYNDSDSHLRIRFQVNKKEDVFQIIEQLNPIFENLLQKNLIWKVQNDIYLREIERYGLTTIEDSEVLFYYDSKMIMEYLFLKNNFEKEKTQLLYSCLAIDSFFNAFSLTALDKLKLLDEMQQVFKKEFNATKILKSELDKHFRKLEKDISNVLNFDANSELFPLYEIIQQKNKNIIPIAHSIKKKIDLNLNSFLSSHIHMMINRQFSSRQREYETLIYDHLFRYYKSCFYRKGDAVSYEVYNSDL